MKPLPSTLNRDGFTLTFMVREGRFAIYRQSKPGTTVEDYEVVIIRQMPQRTINGTVLEAAEVYPRSEDWGTRGWTCQTKEDALAKFRELTDSDLLPET